MVSVEIDPGSGFCGGVIRAIGSAEAYLNENDHLYSLGAIVHNEAELERLAASGLITVSSPRKFLRGTRCWSGPTASRLPPMPPPGKGDSA